MVESWWHLLKGTEQGRWRGQELLIANVRTVDVSGPRRLNGDATNRFELKFLARVVCDAWRIAKARASSPGPAPPAVIIGGDFNLTGEFTCA
eukprot:15475970-Alexandrium_andersonii.AAC.1